MSRVCVPPLGFGSSPATSSLVPSDRILDRVGREAHLVMRRATARPVVAGSAPAERVGAVAAPRRPHRLRGARRPGVGAVVGAAELVVVVGPPLGVAVVAGVDARPPDEAPPLAGDGAHVELAVAVGVADARRRLRPAARELRPARGFETAGSVRVQLVEAGPVQRLVAGPGAAHAGDGRLADELEVVGRAGEPGDRRAGLRIPGLDDVREGEVLVDGEQVDGPVQRQPALDRPTGRRP